MKQAQICGDYRTGKGYISANYTGDIFEEFRQAAYNKRIAETLEHYANINRKQGVTREQLM